MSTSVRRSPSSPKHEQSTCLAGHIDQATRPQCRQEPMTTLQFVIAVSVSGGSRQLAYFLDSRTRNVVPSPIFETTSLVATQTPPPVATSNSPTLTVLR